MQQQISNESAKNLGSQSHASLNPCINNINQSTAAYHSMWSNSAAIFDPSITVTSSAPSHSFAILPTSSSNQNYPVSSAESTILPTSSSSNALVGFPNGPHDGTLLHPMQQSNQSVSPNFNYPMYFSPSTLPLDLTGSQFDPKL